MSKHIKLVHENKKNNLKQQEIVQIDGNIFENLQDLLLQSSQVNFKLKFILRECKSKTGNLSDEIKNAEDKNKDLSNKLKELKVIKTRVLGLAASEDTGVSSQCIMDLL